MNPADEVHDRADRLAARGSVYVTLAAAERFADHEKLGIEAARRRLTEILVSYGRVLEDGPPLRVRARSRRINLDVTAIVVVEAPLLVVVSAAVRSRYRD